MKNIFFCIFLLCCGVSVASDSISIGNRKYLEGILVTETYFLNGGDINAFKSEQRNIFYYDLISTAFSEFGMGYERIFANGFLGFKVPVIVGLYALKKKLFRVSSNLVTGFDLNFYPNKQGRVRYFFGPGFRFGNVRVEDGYTFSNGDVYVDNVDLHKMSGFQLNNGIMFQPATQITLCINMGLGFRTINDRRPDHTGGIGHLIPNYASIGFNLGYRF